MKTLTETQTGRPSLCGAIGKQYAIETWDEGIQVIVWLDWIETRTTKVDSVL